MIIFVVFGKVKYLGLIGCVVLNFVEFEVYFDWVVVDSGINFVKGGMVIMSGSGLGGDGKLYLVSNVVDGNYVNFIFSGYDGIGLVWWMVDLKKEFDIVII